MLIQKINNVKTKQINFAPEEKVYKQFSKQKS